MQINDEIIRLDKGASVQAYLNVITRANYHVIEEVVNMNKADKSLEEVLVRTGIAAKVEARGVARGGAEKALDIAQNLVNLGVPFETVVSATKLDPEKIKTMYDK